MTKTQNFEIGTRVKRGPTWGWRNQDCWDGIQQTGVVTKSIHEFAEINWIDVNWGHREGSYRVLGDYADVVPFKVNRWR